MKRLFVAIFKPSKPNLIIAIYIIIVTTYCRRWINTKKSTVPKCLSLRGGKNWHFALKTSCGALHCCELFHFLLVFLILLMVYFMFCKFAEVLQSSFRDWTTTTTKKDPNLLLIFPQICRWEQWSPTARVLAPWLCWHRPKLSTIPPTPTPFSQGPGSLIHYQQNPTSHSSQTFTPLPLRHPPPMAAGMAAWKLNDFFHHLLFPSLPRGIWT